jgi:DUF3102 family protein
MSSTNTLPPSMAVFDYASLPENVRAEARAIADEIKMRLRGAVIEVGTALLRIKSRLAHGQFGEWLSAEFGLTERTAQNYMAAATLVAKYETVSYLQPRTLYQLAAPTTPDGVRNAVIARLNAGEKVADQIVRDLISEAKRVNEGSGRKPRQREAAAEPEPSTSKEREQQQATASAPSASGPLDISRATDAGRVQNAILQTYLALKAAGSADLLAARRGLDTDQIAQALNYIEASFGWLQKLELALKGEQA